ncbi:Armadillo repeat-containing protein 1 [Acipenser ruthenus]|uniref:Armadillo repeat-containing protein 1 n=1 Tax=Acipenser ruthenus TaxID=7906 RepID=A0A662YV76_ACIRT|nr:Armadillo repeat-containing protein 1 [Acipenser ruthenus]
MCIVLNSPVNNKAAGTPDAPRRKAKSQLFINSSKEKAKSVTLHIQGLDNADNKGICEEALLKVKGVISFTFQMALKRCTMRICSDLAVEVIN